MPLLTSSCPIRSNIWLTLQTCKTHKRLYKYLIPSFFLELPGGSGEPTWPEHPRNYKLKLHCWILWSPVALWDIVITPLFCTFLASIDTYCNDRRLKPHQLVKCIGKHWLMAELSSFFSEQSVTYIAEHSFGLVSNGRCIYTSTSGVMWVWCRWYV